MLDHALASEIVSFLSYTAHAAAAGGLREAVAAEEFAEHAAEELAHARLLMKRLDELGAMPDLEPDTLNARSHSPFDGSTTLEAMLAYQVDAERRAVELYRGAIQWLGDRDPTTRRVLEEILATEERHARDMQTLADSARSGA
ncbi:MAG: ferritin-like domain-containing protein [Alphaproteobacteria bacterium]|nr:ferritin-like domain-containing protein [Alphaproteobacteria bacterium]